MSADKWADEAKRQEEHAAAPQERTVISNATQGYYTNAEGEKIPCLYYKPVDKIAAELTNAAAGWPKVVGGQLFVVNRPDLRTVPRGSEVRLFRRPDDFFAWVQSGFDFFWTNSPVRCTRTKATRTPVTKGEFLKYVEAECADQFAGYSMLPHYPQMPGIFYVPFEPPPSDGTCLRDFRAMFNADSDADADLMLAQLLTPGWGGPTGARPTFVLTSDRRGKGIGKTSTMHAFNRVWGGAVSIRPKDDWDHVFRRLLSDSGLAKRIINFDNVKRKLGGEEFESLVTEDEIDGWRPYFGGYSRPNYLTVYITANSPRLSSDLSMRSVIVKMGPARHERGFRGAARKFIDDNRPALLADIMARLAQPPACTISDHNRDRYNEWQDGVLAGFPNGDALAALCIARRENVDADDEDAQDAAKAIEAYLAAKGHNPENSRVKINRDEMRALLIEAKVIDDRMNKGAVCTWLGNMVDTNGPLAALTDTRIKGKRLWVWDTSDEPPEPEDDGLPPF